MPLSNFPAFKRLLVDHSYKGQSKISWELNPQLVDPGTYYFRLQVSRSGVPYGTDWTNVGIEVADAPYLTDSVDRLLGKNPENYYRVRLRTPEGVYFSDPVGIRGKLNNKDWLTVQEVIRKEQLRHKEQTSNKGYLLRRKRPHDNNVVAREDAFDDMTKEVVDILGNPGEDDDDFGTGLVGGYYAAVPCVFFDLSLESKYIDRDEGTQGTHRDDARSARCLAIPFLDKDDVWVDAESDERYRIKRVTVKAHERNVPVVLEVELILAAASDPIYRVPLEAVVPDPGYGNGTLVVDHNTGGADELRYVRRDNGVGVPARVTIFLKSDYDAGEQAPDKVVAKTTTGDDGRWDHAVNLDPGEYMFVFEDPGHWGPDYATVEI